MAAAVRVRGSLSDGAEVFEGIVGPVCCRRELDTGRCRMKAIVVTDEAAGKVGMRLVERPEPPVAINDVIVQIHASGFVPTEMAWPSTWTDTPGSSPYRS